MAGEATSPSSGATAATGGAGSSAGPAFVVSGLTDTALATRAGRSPPASPLISTIPPAAMPRKAAPPELSRAVWRVEPAFFFGRTEKLEKRDPPDLPSTGA